MTDISNLKQNSIQTISENSLDLPKNSIDDSPFYSLNNVDQCWQCKLREGSKSFSFKDILNVDFPYLPVTDTFLVKLPACKVTDKYMTSIYDSRCKYFIYDTEWERNLNK